MTTDAAEPYAQFERTYDSTWAPTNDNEWDLTANERVNHWILAEYRKHGWTPWRVGNPNFPDYVKPHLIDCPDAKVEHLDGSNGYYGCDTGCEYSRLECTITCPHGESAEYEYGSFADLADILREIDSAT